MSTMRLLVVGSDAPYAAAIREVLTAQLPDAISEAHAPAHVRTRPTADAVVIDARSDTAMGAKLAAKTRAMGFAGALVLVGEWSDDAERELAAAGGASVAPDALASQLVARLAEQMELAGSEHAEQVMRARRLVAAGEIAIGFQHSLNNPLAGILAEAQLMQLDTLGPEQHAALGRIIGLCRRIIELGRSLDGMGQRN